ncbi:unnamed protein product [Fraxinus pennsylvanica]|uniref:non-specific serine/threonine protein kinase n=1 Tax=Fraxinus pennsylvanica TaxID=56036 RepID=A0AAD2E829_9LAMI|nr:unnamed protein product [Fraxinus pennsylvanica]
MPRLFTFSPPPASAMPPSPSLFSLITIFIATILTAAHSQHTNTTSSSYANCNRTFTCGTIRNIIYPFTGGDRPSYCGLPEFTLTCRDNNVTELTQNSVAYRVLRLDQAEKFMILAPSLLYDNPCPSEFYNSTLNSTLFRYEGPENEVVNLIYGCNGSAMSVKPQNHFNCGSSISNFTDSYYIIGPVSTDPILRFIVCSVSIRVPVLKDSGERLTGSRISLGEALMLGFSVKYNDPYQSICSKCNGSGGQCGFDRNSGQPVCICDDKLCPSAPAPPPEATRNASPVADHLHGKWEKSGLLSWPIRLNIAIETADALAYLHKSDIVHRDSFRSIRNEEYNLRSSSFKVANLRRNLLSKFRWREAEEFKRGRLRKWRQRWRLSTAVEAEETDVGWDNSDFGVQIFSYCDLEEATDNFDRSRELGDGDFGTVYYGLITSPFVSHAIPFRMDKSVLRDGSVVAVKRLYENNFKRVEQFRNEVEILTQLRHRNLVTLYRCTSKSSRDLVLVYEYIPNGTVADHLHGKWEKSSLI